MRIQYLHPIFAHFFRFDHVELTQLK